MRIACTLTGDDLAAQARRWGRLRAAAELERLEVEDGLRIRFRSSPGVEEELRALVAVESECCAWASWEVVPEPESLVLAASSAGAGVATLHGMFRDVARL